MTNDYLTYGFGLCSATFAYLADKVEESYLIVDKRPQLGENIFFVNVIVALNRNTNYSDAIFKGKFSNLLPFNLNTFHQMWRVIKPYKRLKLL